MRFLRRCTLMNFPPSLSLFWLLRVFNLGWRCVGMDENGWKPRERMILRLQMRLRACNAPPNPHSNIPSCCGQQLLRSTEQNRGLTCNLHISPVSIHFPLGALASKPVKLLTCSRVVPFKSQASHHITSIQHYTHLTHARIIISLGLMDGMERAIFR